MTLTPALPCTCLEGPAPWLHSCTVQRDTRKCGCFTPDIPQSELAATNVFDRAKSWLGEELDENWAKFWTKFSGHFRASFTVQNDPPKFLPKFLPIYHFMSCHGSCDRNLKISSSRASGAWGDQAVTPPCSATPFERQLDV